MIDRALLARCVAAYNIEVTDELYERLDIYARLLVEWNEKMNLTAITDPVGITVKHFADSLTAAPLLPAGAFSLLDVGTGAGFPGVPVTLIHARAEEGGRQKHLREKFDVVTARAVAALPVLSEYCLPFAKVGGRFLALKGPDAEKEQAAAERAVNLLGGRVAQVESLRLPATDEPGVETMERRLVCIEKVRHTPPAYPRQSAKISKQPL